MTTKKLTEDELADLRGKALHSRRLPDRKRYTTIYKKLTGHTPQEDERKKNG